MKESIENSIKKSLENHEMAYNPTAWKNLSQKLDAKQPVLRPKSNLKMYAAAATVVLVSIASYFGYTHFNQSGDEVVIADTVAQNETTSHQNLDNNSTSTSENTITNSNNTLQDDHQETVTEIEPIENVANSENEDDPIIHDIINIVNGDDDKNVNDSEELHTPGDVQVRVTLPTISNQCQNTSINVKNSNKVAIIIEGPSNSHRIEGNTSKSILLKSAGVYSVKAYNSAHSTEQTTFIVRKAPNVDFIIDSETKFEEGLPTTKVESIGSAANYSWTSTNGTQYGETADIHIYNKGNHTITLTAEDNYGCKKSISKSIYIPEKYNLMATKAFVPTDIDPRNNIFMPLALTLRNVRFQLIVIDPTDGHVLFQSTDANHGWDGTDKDTGRPVKTETAYIWKVVLENPAAGESNEYAGSIIPMASRR